MWTQQQRPALASAYTLTPSRHHLLHKPPLRPSNAPNAATTAQPQPQPYPHTRDDRPQTRGSRQPYPLSQQATELDTSSSQQPDVATTRAERRKTATAAPMLSYAYGAPTLPGARSSGSPSSPRGSGAPLDTTVNIATAFAQAAAVTVSPHSNPFAAPGGGPVKRRGNAGNGNGEEEGSSRARGTGPATRRRSSRGRGGNNVNDLEPNHGDDMNILDSDDDGEYFTPSAAATQKTVNAATKRTGTTISGRLWDTMISKSPPWLHKTNAYTEIDDDDPASGALRGSEHEKENQDTTNGQRQPPRPGGKRNKPRRESGEYAEYAEADRRDQSTISSRYHFRERTPGRRLKLEYSLSDESPPSTAIGDGMWDDVEMDDVDVIRTEDEGNPYEEEERMYAQDLEDEDDGIGRHRRASIFERLRMRSAAALAPTPTFRSAHPLLPPADFRNRFLATTVAAASATTPAPTGSYSPSGSDPTGDDSYSGDFSDTEDSFDTLTGARTHGVRRVVRRTVPVWGPAQRLLARFVTGSGSWLVTKLLFGLFLCIWLAKEIAVIGAALVASAIATVVRGLRTYVVSPAGLVSEMAHVGWGRAGEFVVETVGLALVWLVEIVTMAVLTGKKLATQAWLWARKAWRRILRRSKVWGPAVLMASCVILVIALGVRYVRVGGTPGGVVSHSPRVIPRPPEPLSPGWTLPKLNSWFPSFTGWRPKHQGYVPPPLPPDSADEIVERLMKLEHTVHGLKETSHTLMEHNNRMEQTTAIESDRTAEIAVRLQKLAASVQATAADVHRIAQEEVPRQREQMEKIVHAVAITDTQVVEVQRRIDEIAGGLGASNKDVAALKTGVEGVKRDMEALKRHVDTVTHPDNLTKALQATLESVLPSHLMVRINSKTGRVEVDPELWRYLKGMFVNKEQVESEVREQVEAVRREAGAAAEVERRERMAIGAAVEAERKERVEQGKKFSSKEQVEAEVKGQVESVRREVERDRAERTAWGKLFTGRELFDALQKEVKALMGREQVEALVKTAVEKERSDRQRDERLFVHKDQVDATVKTQVDAVRHEVLSVVEKERDDVRRAVTAATVPHPPAKVSPPLWDEFVQHNQVAIDTFIRQHVERNFRDLARSEGVIVSKRDFMDILVSEMDQLRQEMGQIKSEALDAVNDQRQQDQRRHRVPVDVDLTEASAVAIQQLIDSALQRYAEDVLAMPDYALFSSGARVIPSLTSRTYEAYPPSLKGRLAAKVFGIGLARGSPPQMALHPDTHVGECWSFHGAQGELGVRLSRDIVVTDVTVEHVGKHIAHDLGSAPREIELWGVDWREVEGESVRSREPFLIAEFTYDIDDENPIQTFPVSRRHLRSDRAVHAVVFKVKSNWGHLDFTCLYRVRVHGRPVEA